MAAFDLDSLAARALRTRWLVRALIPLFRARLGWMLGGRLVLLEHRGRQTGARRFVMLEIVERQDPRTIVIASGFGRSAQWYRNLRANGVAITIVGVRRRRAEPEFLDAAASRGRLERYAVEHPVAWRHLEGAMAIDRGEEHPEIPLVLLRLAPGSD